jgi:hypothetical protein
MNEQDTLQIITEALADVPAAVAMATAMQRIHELEVADDKRELDELKAARDGLLKQLNERHRDAHRDCRRQIISLKESLNAVCDAIKSGDVGAMRAARQEHWRKGILTDDELAS